MIDCPYCHGSGEGRQVKVDVWLACPYCRGGGMVDADWDSAEKCEWCGELLTMAETAGRVCDACQRYYAATEPEGVRV